MPRAPKQITAAQALKRLARLRARLPDDVKEEFDKITGQLQAAISTAQGERQAMADAISQHESSIAELQARSSELGQANANQARLLSALTQPSGEPSGQATIVRPTGGFFPTGIPSIAPTRVVDPPPSTSPNPTPAPSATPAAIASAFQQAFSALQTPAGAPGAAIRSMDVQIKGFVQVSSDGSETTLTFPSAENPISGDLLSTVSMSLGAVPELTPTKPPG